MLSNKKSVPAGLIIAISCIFQSAGVNAEEIMAGGSFPSSIFDSNNDGKISKEEFNAVFTEFDSNTDGQLDRDEIMAGRLALMKKHYEKVRQEREKLMQEREKQMQERMKSRPARRAGMMPTYDYCDLNGDGKIPEEEFNKAREKHMSEMKERGYPMKHMSEKPAFSEIDSNGDGNIDRDEFRQHQSEQCHKMHKHHGMMWDKRRHMQRDSRDEDSMPGPRAFFSDFDANDDGKVTEEEFNTFRSNRMAEMKKRGYPMRNVADAPSFKDIDSNSDGSISEEELYNMQAQRREQMIKKRREMMEKRREEMMREYREYRESRKRAEQERRRPDYPDYY